jgi:hypothetical protein
MLSGSPTSNRNAGGPGLDRQIVARALAYLKGHFGWPPTATESTASEVALIPHENQTRSDASASEAPAAIHDHTIVLMEISPGGGYFSRARQD